MFQSNFCSEREALIGRETACLASELRLIDIEFLISFITLQMHGHIADHVKSSAERFFRPGFITMGQGCKVSVTWESAPEVTIDLIMNMGWAKAYLGLHMRATDAYVRLEHFSAVVQDVNEHEEIQRLRDTIKLNKLDFPCSTSNGDLTTDC